MKTTLILWAFVMTMIALPAVQCAGKNAKVLVLGAGAAGLAATFTLKNSGVDVVTLEGTGRFGGRVKPANFNGVPIELGANWINGYGPGNPLYPLAIAAGLNCSLSSTTGVFGSQGAFAQAEGTEAVDYIGGYLLYILTNYSRPEDTDYISALTFAIGDIDNFSEAQLAALQGLVANGGNLPELGSVKWNRQAATSSWGRDCLVVDPDGYEKLLKYVVNLNNLAPSIVLNQQVYNITYTDNGVQVYVTGDPVPYTADYAIVTFSLGVLKNKTSLFTPPLPQVKRDAINKWGYGNLMKVWLQFDQGWWPNDQTLWYFASKQLAVNYPSLYLNLNSPLRVSGSKTILFFAIGEHATRIATQSKNATIAEFSQIIKTMFPSAPYRQAVDVRFQDWSQDPWTYGSYSYGKLGVTESDFRNMSNNVGRVYFAGEHTSHYYWGYVHGAMMEGAAKASTILDILNTTQTSTTRTPTSAPTTAPTSAPTPSPTSTPTSAPTSVPTAAPTPKSDGHLLHISICMYMFVTLLLCFF